MKQIKIGIFGATGLVGQAMLECIERLEIPFSELRLFASKKSAGKKVNFLGNDYMIEEISEANLRDLDVLFGAVSASVSRAALQMIKNSGVLYIDNSSAFRLDNDVPLIIPEINLNDIQSNHRRIANPNCSTILTLLSAAPIHQLFGIKKMVVSTYQAVSGAGKKGMDELICELTEFPNAKADYCVFQQPIVNNCIASIGTLEMNGFTSEEMKMQNESRKILHHDSLEVACTCVRVPILRSHCISIYCETEKNVDLNRLYRQYHQMLGIRLCDDFPSPLMASNQFDVFVGRIRKDLYRPNAVLLWCCGDQIYKGAALNAIQIAQSLLLK